MRHHVVATWGKWDQAFQEHSHSESFAPSSHWIVFTDGKPMGIVAAELERSHVQLVKLYLRTGARGHGVGARIIGALLRSAAQRDRPLRLRVLAVNTRAQAFYSRHGFREAFRTAERVFMEARPKLSVARTSSSKLRLPPDA